MLHKPIRFIPAIATLAVLAGLMFAPSALADRTVQLGNNCSATAYTPSASGQSLSFTGGNSCAGSDGKVSKAMEVCAMVDFGGVWVNIPGECVSSSGSGNPLKFGVAYGPCAAGADFTTDVYSVTDVGNGWSVGAGSIYGYVNGSTKVCP